MQTGFTFRLAHLNSITVSCWLLGQGMGFAHDSKWWAEGQRPAPHNGLDLYRYRDGKGVERTIEPGALVPMLMPGRVIALAPDYIGTSVFVLHEEHGLMSAFGHMDPAAVVSAGSRLGADAVLGRIARSARAACPSHLHISVAETTDVLPELTWETLEGAAGVRFLDPEGYLY